MGRSKLLLPWGTRTVLSHLLAQWRDLNVEQIAVVGAAADAALADELERLGVPPTRRIINPWPDRGMFSSIQCAARWRGWNASLTRFAIALGDQPHVRTETLRAVLECAAVRPGQVCQPSRHGRGRHPVILPAEVFRQLADATAPTLKHFLQARPEPVAFCELEDPGLDLDLDRPEDYQQALELRALKP